VVLEMINNLTYCTINTDASFKDGQAGLAFYVIADFPNQPRPYRTSMSASCEAKDSTEAEIMALVVALQYIKNHNTRWDYIVWNTDSLIGMDYFNGRGGQCERYIKLVKAARELCSEMCGSAYAKKVKAHSNINDARHYINNRLDLKAKGARKK
jgi:ribonuclease HI